MRPTDFVPCEDLCLFTDAQQQFDSARTLGDRLYQLVTFTFEGSAIVWLYLVTGGLLSHAASWHHCAKKGLGYKFPRYSQLTSEKLQF
jgi:hypothetical protein